MRQYLGRRLSMTAKAVRASVDQQMVEAGSSLTVAIITRILAATPGLAQRDIAERLGIEGPTMARHIERLERDGIIERKRDGNDRRVLRVQLTAKGKALGRQLVAVSERADRELVSVFTPAELEQFEEYLDRIAAHASALLDERRGRQP